MVFCFNEHLETFKHKTTCFERSTHCNAMNLTNECINWSYWRILQSGPQRWPFTAWIPFLAEMTVKERERNSLPCCLILLWTCINFTFFLHMPILKFPMVISLSWFPSPSSCYSIKLWIAEDRSYVKSCWADLVYIISSLIGMLFSLWVLFCKANFLLHALKTYSKSIYYSSGYLTLQKHIVTNYLHYIYD